MMRDAGYKIQDARIPDTRYQIPGLGIPNAGFKKRFMMHD